MVEGKSVRQSVIGKCLFGRVKFLFNLVTNDATHEMKDGVHLCAFPEGTRSKNGRLLPFKNGAFKMAFKVGAPIIPISIIASGKAMPSNWMFPKRMCNGVCKVVVHAPIESTGRTEADLAALVRQAVIDGLPEDQHPLDEYTDDDDE
jgi:1-acyl-sn-glycerol-3-phosphate acyltransferase